MVEHEKPQEVVFKPHKVVFDIDIGLLTWDFFDENGIDQIKADPVGTAFGLLHREAQSIADQKTDSGYGGRSFVPSAVDSIFIEIESERSKFIPVDGKDIRAHVESGSTSAGAYGELTPDQIALTRETFIRIFAPESIVVPPMPRPIETTRDFGRSVHHEIDPATLAPPPVSRLVNWTPPEEPPYDGIISLGPVS